MLGNPNRENWFVFPRPMMPVSANGPDKRCRFYLGDWQVVVASAANSECKSTSRITLKSAFLNLDLTSIKKLTGVLPQGCTGKDVIVALCGLFSKDEVLNHAIEFTGSEETMRSLPVDARLTIANMTTEVRISQPMKPWLSQLKARNVVFGLPCSR